MSQKHVSLMIFALIFTIGTPFFIAKNLQLGSFAKSPQEVKMSLGSTATVAGGRASLWFAGGDTGADFEIRCKEQQTYFQPSYDEPACEACGIRVEFLELTQKSPNRPPKAVFKVSWK